MHGFHGEATPKRLPPLSAKYQVQALGAEGALPMAAAYQG